MTKIKLTADSTFSAFRAWSVQWSSIKCFTLLYFIEICYTYRIVSATGEENRTMSQLIFNPNKY